MTARTGAAGAGPSQPLLDVRDLGVSFETPRGPVRAVDGTSFTIGAGEAVGLVGESGSGKTATALALMGLLPRGAARIDHGSSIDFTGLELVGAPPRELRTIRGRRMSMVFQDPKGSLNPVHPVGDQVAEVLRHHRGLSRSDARTRVVELLREVGIRRPEARYDDPPHRLSGGMRQRVVIAMAIACEPRLVIADEPTSSLDVTVQARILDLLRRLRATHDTALLLVSHDVGVVADVCDRVLVMHAGRIVESGPTDRLFREPRHACTRRLLDALPQLGGSDARGVGRRARREGVPLVEVRDLVVDYARARGGLLPATWGGADGGEAPKAVDGVSLSIERGETLGLVGESGCGKSTTARALLHLRRPTAGTVLFDGHSVGAMSRRELRRLRSRAQIVFQDPSAALNPRMTARRTLEEVLRVHRVVEGAAARSRRVQELLHRVGLTEEHGERLPHELSGGQIQRVGIARALAVEPEFVVLDEPVSALDASIRTQIVDLLLGLQAELALTYLFIAHDLAVVARMSDRIAVMHRGRIVETGPSETVIQAPRHPRTKALIEAVPRRPEGGRPPASEGARGV